MLHKLVLCNQIEWVWSDMTVFCALYRHVVDQSGCMRRHFPLTDQCDVGYGNILNHFQKVFCLSGSCANQLQGQSVPTKSDEAKGGVIAVHRLESNGAVQRDSSEW